MEAPRLVGERLVLASSVRIRGRAIRGDAFRGDAFRGVGQQHTPGAPPPSLAHAQTELPSGACVNGTTHFSSLAPPLCCCRPIPPLCCRTSTRYFYESTTGVYYDPRSKLYCKDMQWHSYTPGQDPAFTPVTQQQGGGGAAHQQHPATNNASADRTAAAREAAATATAAAAAAAAPTPASKAPGAKRIGGGWKKSSRLAFGFKGNKLGKAGAGGGGGVGASGVLGGADSQSSGDENGDAGDSNGGAAEPAAAAVGVGGALAKKRQLQDVSKWNARRREVRSCVFFFFFFRVSAGGIVRLTSWRSSPAVGVRLHQGGGGGDVWRLVLWLGTPVGSL